MRIRFEFRGNILFFLLKAPIWRQFWVSLVGCCRAGLAREVKLICIHVPYARIRFSHRFFRTNGECKHEVNYQNVVVLVLETGCKLTRFEFNNSRSWEGRHRSYLIFCTDIFRATIWAAFFWRQSSWRSLFIVIFMRCANCRRFKCNYRELDNNSKYSIVFDATKSTWMSQV